jgi:hypothetical protein
MAAVVTLSRSQRFADVARAANYAPPPQHARHQKSPSGGPSGGGGAATPRSARSGGTSGPNTGRRAPLVSGASLASGRGPGAEDSASTGNGKGTPAAGQLLSLLASPSPRPVLTSPITPTSARSGGEPLSGRSVRSGTSHTGSARSASAAGDAQSPNNNLKKTKKSGRRAELVPW